MPIIAIAGAVIGAASLGNAIYNEVNAPSGPAGWQTGGGTLAQQAETPQERQFYEMQSLAAENAATQEEIAAQIQSNNSDTVTSYAKFGAIAVALYLVYAVAHRKKLI